MFQPEGPHGPSRVVDHRDFRWSDEGWAGLDPRDGVIYELHLGTFSPSGDVDGAVARLDHLVDLGVTSVCLLPVVQFSGARNWGYDGVDLFAPHHAYGGPDGIKRLVDACHARGLGVIFDVVYNHLGPEGNYLGYFGPYFTDFYRTPWGEAVNYDRAGSDEVRRFVIDNALMWLRDYHGDGLRLDAVHAIVDTSAVHVLEQMSVEVDALEAELGRPLTLIAESDLNDPRLCRPREDGGYGLEAQWSDDLHHALHAVLTGESSGYYADFGGLGHLATALRHGWVYTGEYSGYRDRRHGRPPDGLRPAQLLGYAQNHDQVGNRAVGDRLGALVGPNRVRIAGALVLCAPFTPMLFQGEEWGSERPFQYFTDHQDRELGRAVAQGRRAEFASFGWAPDEVPDPQDPATFERSRLDWEEPARQPHAAVLEWFRALVRLRAATPELRDGPFDATDVRASDAESWLVVTRGPITVAVNLAPTTRRVAVPDGRVVLASDPSIEPVDGHVELPADSVAVLDSREEP
jgi:maltooligosyltrehalose trehalohydrolase